MKKYQVQPTGQRAETLTSHEYKQMTVGPSITTLTFLRYSKDKPTKQLKSKLGEIVKLNPWLAGTLVKKGKNLQLLYPDTPAEEDIDKLFKSYKSSEAPIVHSEMPLENLWAVVGGSSAEVPAGTKCINKGKPLLALSVLEDSKRPTDTIAVVLSISHVIIDGYNYYQILSMLNQNSIIEQLSPQRKHEIVEEAKSAMGKQEAAFAHSNAIICNVICTMLCSSKKAKIKNYLLDSNRITEMKKNATSSEVNFVSTNDIICSTFGNSTEARALLLPLNFRGRLPGYTKTDAGNYEGALVFGPEDFAVPSLIRKTVQSGPPTYMRSVGKPLPAGFCGRARCRLAMVTSWLFDSFSELTLENCTQIFHMPICDPKMVPFEICVVYRPCANKIALAILSRTLDDETIKSGLPVGDVLSRAETTALSN